MKKTVSAVPIRMNVVGADFHYYLSGPVGEAAQYVDLIDILYSGKEADTVYIHLNTPGGSLDTTMQILNAIRSAECKVVGIADGPVCSAGTLILLSCPNIGIQDFSYLMLHDASEGTFGKASENLRQVQFTSKLISNICREIYYPFFSHKEIDEILDGKDYWITAEEINERIIKAKESVKEKDTDE